MNIRKYLKIWWIMTVSVSQIALTSRFSAIIFIVGKILRFFFFLLFLLILVSKIKTVAGYSIWEVVFFFATFNLVDIIAQLFLREVYRFRSYVVSGDFDYFLTKPLSPLFRSLFGGSDILDIPILILSIIFILFSLGKIGNISVVGIALYILLIFNAFLIATSFHILVLAVGILTTEVDNTLWLYRDLTQMGRVPVDIYREPLRGILTFAVPVGIMMTFPSKALMGLLSIQPVAVALSIGVVLFYLSFKFWKFALKHYSSASS